MTLLAALAIVAALIAPSPFLTAAHALTVPELICQQSTGKEALRFLEQVERAERRCADAEAADQTCDDANRAATIAAARDKLGRKLAGRCDGIVLENLGFPASCDDPGGAPFSIEDLGECIDVSHQERIATAIAVAYPGAPGTLGGDPLRCQRAIGNAGGQLVAQRLRARQSCSNDQLSGRIAPSVDCQAEPPPIGAGTGHAKTDRRLVTALDRADTVIARSCTDVALDNLGFPGTCSDGDGAPFTIADLQACIRERHAQLADELLDVEYAH